MKRRGNGGKRKKRWKAEEAMENGGSDRVSDDGVNGGVSLDGASDH